MKVEEVPQDLKYFKGTVVRDVDYAVDADGNCVWWLYSHQAQKADLIMNIATLCINTLHNPL